MNKPPTQERLSCVSIAELNCDDIVVEEADVQQLLCELLAARALARKRGLTLVCHLIEMAMVETVERTGASVGGSLVKRSKEAA